MKAMRALAAVATLLLAACGDGSIQSPDFTSELVSLSARVKDSGSTTASVPAGRTVDLEAIGTFTAPPGSSETTRVVTSVDWASSNAAVATVDNGGKVTAVGVGVANVTASRDGKTSNPVVITVTPAVLDSLFIARSPDTTQTQISSDTVPRGTQREYQAVGVYSDGSRATVASNWVSANPEVAAPATVPPGPSATRAIAVPQTAIDGASTTITVTAAQDATISTTLTITVSDAVCSTALRSSAYTATGATNGLCIGCSVTTPEAVIDADDANFATVTLPVTLLLANATLDVKPTSTGGGTPFPGGSNAGFLISRETSALLGAELLSTVTVSTLLDGAVQESSDSVTNILQVDLLGISLLPIGDIPSETAAVSFLTTKPYNGLRLTYNGGVLNVLSTMRVFNACGTLVPPQTN